jgi:hypothetical protein
MTFRLLLLKMHVMLVAPIIVFMMDIFLSQLAIITVRQVGKDRLLAKDDLPLLLRNELLQLLVF